MVQPLVIFPPPPSPNWLFIELVVVVVVVDDADDDNDDDDIMKVWYKADQGGTAACGRNSKKDAPEPYCNNRTYVGVSNARLENDDDDGEESSIVVVVVSSVFILRDRLLAGSVIVTTFVAGILFV